MNGGSQPNFILQRNRLLSRRLITVPLIEFPPAGVTDVAQSPYLRRLADSDVRKVTPGKNKARN